MKKFLLTIAFVSALSSVSAQTETTTEETSESGYNRWSIELNGGVNKPQNPFTTSYSTSTPSPYNVDFGVRYMFNPKFGIKGDIGYYNFKEGGSSLPFETNYYRANLNFVANLGRILAFEDWTKSIGLLGHVGGGFSQMKSENHDFTDRMGNFMVGFTAQLKLSDRIVLNGDFSSITNVSQSRTFDGYTSTIEMRGFNGGLFQGTLGLTVYLGGNQTHADWYVDSNKTKEEVEALQKRLGDLETMMNDSDKDGVPDYLDAEPNSMTGVAVDSKGRTVDQNNNGVPDELESYMQKTYGDNINKSSIANTPSNSELVKALINDGYVTTYFDFNKTTPTNVSTEGIDFILTYLRNNPGSSVDIIGHADEIGRSAYNDKLSNSRANSVKNTLVKAKIDPARLNIVPAGEDTSVDKTSADARKLVRRVTFRVK